MPQDGIHHSAKEGILFNLRHRIQNVQIEADDTITTVTVDEGIDDDSICTERKGIMPDKRCIQSTDCSIKDERIGQTEYL